MLQALLEAHESTLQQLGLPHSHTYVNWGCTVPAPRVSRVKYIQLYTASAVLASLSGSMRVLTITNYSIVLP